MTRAIEGRLRKLEAKRRSVEGLFYLVWGRDEAEVERTVMSARAAGIVRPGDTLVSALWTAPEAMRASRWVGSMDRLSDAELDALLAALKDVCRARYSAEKMAAAEAAPYDPQFAHLSDAQLTAVSLGVVVR
jgi:hypothetical protein